MVKGRAEFLRAPRHPCGLHMRGFHTKLLAMLRVSAPALLLLCASCAKHGLHTGPHAAGDAAVAAETVRDVEDGQGAAGRDGAADGAGDMADAADVALARVLDTGSDFGSGETLAVDAEHDVSVQDVARDLGASELADTPVGSELDAGPACVAHPEPPPDVPSRQTVRFHFVSSSPGYVVSKGSECLPFVIEASGDGGMTPILLDVRRNDSNCEGSQYYQALPAGAIALGQNGGATLTWDARRLEAHLLCVDCAAQGWGTSSSPLTLYTRVPVAPDHYRATFAVLDSLPANCKAVDGGVSCERWPGPADMSHDQLLKLCPSSRTLTVDFELPSPGNVDSASGDVDVTVNDIP